MFLATTALSEFWEKDQEILFLGNWCRRGSRREEWERLKFHVLPCPWDDRRLFYEAVRYLEKVYERMLESLAEYLNAAHGVSHSLRYWRIVLGPWLLHFLHQYYDRYVHLTEADRHDPRFQTLVPALIPFLGIADAEELAVLTIGDGDEVDGYNLQLYAQILSGMGKQFPVHVPSSSRQQGAVTRKKSGLAPGARLKRALHQVSWRLGQALLRSGCGRVVFCDLTGNPPVPVHALPLLWSKGIRAVPFTVQAERSISKAAPAFDHRRKGLATLTSRDEFERIFVRFLPTNFPTGYLEGYPARQAPALSRSRFPAAILSATGWYYNEEFKLFAAEAAERNRTRLLAVQHGGGYGQLRSCPHEQHERQLADRFMAWGWANDDGGSVRSLPNPILSQRFGRPVRRSPCIDRVLLVCESNPRYLYRFQTSQLATQMEEYVAWEERFLAALPRALRGVITIQPHPMAVDHPINLKGRIGDRWPEVRWNGQRPFVKGLSETRLAVVDYCGGPLLESLCADVPTLAFWNPARWEMRPDAEPYFEELRQVGILWDAPEGAAAKFVEIAECIEDWWRDPSLQRARRRFADRYALARPDWLDAWSRALREELALGGGAQTGRVPGY